MCSIIFKLTQGISQSWAQFLLHHQLRDSFPSQPILNKPHLEWVVVVQHHKEILHHCKAKIVERYNRYTNNLSPLQAGDTVAIQSPLNHQWCTMGKINTVQPDHQYQIRFDGSERITLKNCCFLRKCESKATLTLIPSATPGLITSTSTAPLLHLNHPTFSSNDMRAVIERPPPKATYTSSSLQSLKILSAQSRLLPHNRPGLKEEHSLHPTLPIHGGVCET